MNRSRKTLFALLLALVMTLGLAATAWATGEVASPDTDTLELEITKIVKQTDNVAPPAETFTFELEDVVGEGEPKRELDDYGIKLMADGLKISTTAGTGTFEKTFKFKLPTSDVVVDKWDRVANEENEYRKTFLLKEKDGGKAGWVYSNESYYAVFTYNIREQKKGLEVYVSGDATSPAEFTNTYTENLRTVEVPFTKTVKLGGNTAPGKTDFTLEIFDIGNGTEVNYKDVTYTAAVTTPGAGSYNGELVISGPADQVGEFICEGFYVREVKGNLSGWTYSDAVWCVEPEDPHGEENVRLMKIYPATMETTDDGEVHFREVEGAAAEEEMTFENVYTYNHTTQAQRPAEKPNTPETITAPKTFDAGVALYGVSALLSLTGTALVIKRKNG